jgi:ABC-type transport system substrate-binding protein
MTNRFAIRRRTLLGGLALGALASALPRTGFGQETPAAGGILRYATLGLDTADPHRHTGSIAVQQIYVETLTSIANDGSVEPFLAESFTVSEDGKTYTFVLRDGVTFHNGDVMTSADVVANFERVKNNVEGGWLASAMKLVDTITAPDARTVVLAMSEPYAPLLNLLSELWILSPKSPGWDETITLPIGTGPFKFGEWLPKVSLTAPRHETYWQAGLPYLDGIEADLRDDVDKVLALRAGDLDLISIERDAAEPLRSDPAFEIETMKDTSWYFVSFNNRAPRPPFDDIRVREAVCYAIDKAAFMQFVAGDDGVVTNQMVAPGNAYFDQAMHDADRHAKPDLERARALLAEAGVDPAATTIEFVSWQDAYAQVAVQMVRQLGFTVNHVALDDLGAQNRLGQYDWDMNCMGSGPRADIFLRYVRLMSDGPNPVLWGGVQDPELDRLVKAAVAQPDFEARKQLYLQAWQRVLDHDYTVVIGHAAELIATRAAVRGYEPGFTWSPNWVSGGVGHAWLSTSA